MRSGDQVIGRSGDRSEAESGALKRPVSSLILVLMAEALR
jgi:hypothetical protein